MTAPIRQGTWMAAVAILPALLSSTVVAQCSGATIRLMEERLSVAQRQVVEQTVAVAQTGAAKHKAELARNFYRQNLKLIAEDEQTRDCQLVCERRE